MNYEWNIASKNYNPLSLVSSTLQLPSIDSNDRTALWRMMECGGVSENIPLIKAFYSIYRHILVYMGIRTGVHQNCILFPKFNYMINWIMESVY